MYWLPAWNGVAESLVIYLPPPGPSATYAEDIVEGEEEEDGLVSDDEEEDDDEETVTIPVTQDRVSVAIENSSCVVIIGFLPRMLCHQEEL